jgi:hypothetical protein
MTFWPPLLHRTTPATWIDLYVVACAVTSSELEAPFVVDVVEGVLDPCTRVVVEGAGAAVVGAGTDVVVVVSGIVVVVSGTEVVVDGGSVVAVEPFEPGSACATLTPQSVIAGTAMRTRTIRRRTGPSRSR